MKFTKREIFSIPNLMGYARILLLPVIAAVYLSADTALDYWIAGGLFLFSAILDWLDGQVARRFHMVTDLGKMVDPIADKLTQAVAALCLATRYPLMVPLLALMAVKELYMGIRGAVHLARGGEVYGAFFWGKVCTALLFVTFCFLLFIPTMPLIYVNLLIVLSMLCMAVTLGLYIRYFYREKHKADTKRHPRLRMAALIVLLSLLLIFLFLVIGAIAPFAVQKELSEETASAFSAEDFWAGENKGERVMLLEENTHALAERIRLLERAEEEIILTTFDIREGKAIRDIGAMLLKKADDGVKVRVLCDSFNFEMHMGGSALIDALTAHENIEFRVYNRINVLTPWTSQGRMHDKYLIVDDLAYIIGGRNTIDYFLTDDTVNGSFDRELLIYEATPSNDDSLHDLKAYFESVWGMDTTVPYREDATLAEKTAVMEAGADLRAHYAQMRTGEYAACFAPFDYTANTYPAEAVKLLSNPIGIYGKEPVLFCQLIELMKEADTRVSIHTPYAVLDDYMLEMLRSLREEKTTLNLRMMLNGVENGDNFVACSDYLYNKDRVLETGMRIFEYQGGTSYHGKAVLIDNDVSIVGSFNFDMRSAYINTELMLAVRSEELNSQLSACFDAYEAESVEQLPDGTQIVPPAVTVEDLSLGGKILRQFFGFVLQPFRFLA